MTLLIIILVIIAIYFIFFIAQFFNIIFKGYAPFISTDHETIKKIIAELEIPAKPIIYELGCGRARFLKIAERNFPQAKLIGIENLATLYLINKIRLVLVRSRVNLLRSDFFKINLQDADLIYCYLNNATMQSLGEKFKQECRPGMQIVSRSFPIPQFSAEKVIRIKNKNIYFYKI